MSWGPIAGGRGTERRRVGGNLLAVTKILLAMSLIDTKTAIAMLTRRRAALMCKDKSCAEVGPTVSRRKRVGVLVFGNLATRSKSGRMIPKLTRD